MFVNILFTWLLLFPTVTYNVPHPHINKQVGSNDPYIIAVYEWFNATQHHKQQESQHQLQTNVLMLSERPHSDDSKPQLEFYFIMTKILATATTSFVPPKSAYYDTVMYAVLMNRVVMQYAQQHERDHQDKIIEAQWKLFWTFGEPFCPLDRVKAVHEERQCRFRHSLSTEETSNDVKASNYFVNEFDLILFVLSLLDSLIMKFFGKKVSLTKKMSSTEKVLYEETLSVEEAFLVKETSSVKDTLSIDETLIVNLDQKQRSQQPPEQHEQQSQIETESNNNSNLLLSLLPPPIEPISISSSLQRAIEEVKARSQQPQTEQPRLHQQQAQQLPEQHKQRQASSFINTDELFTNLSYYVNYGIARELEQLLQAQSQQPPEQHEQQSRIETESNNNPNLLLSLLPPPIEPVSVSPSLEQQQTHFRPETQQPQPQEQQASASQLSLPTSMFFVGCAFVFDENIALKQRAMLISIIKAHGGESIYSVTDKATHFVMKENAEKLSKKLAAARRSTVYKVRSDFISDSVSSGKRKSESDYIIVLPSAPLPLPNESSSTQ